VRDDERVVVERERGTKNKARSDQRSILANSIVVVAAGYTRRRESRDGSRPELRTERGKLLRTDGRDAVGWTNRCAARVVEANEELASGEKSSDNRTGAIERVDWRHAFD
jgi:hypothetical protein